MADERLKTLFPVTPAKEVSRHCTRCDQTKTIAHFRWLKKHHRGKPEVHRDSWCAQCRREYKRTPEYRLQSNARLQKRRLEDPEFREKQRLSSAEFFRKNREGILKRMQAAIKKQDGGYVGKRILRKFGITFAEYCAMRDQQQNKCAICDREEHTKQRRLAVDHNHQTLEVRALLCHHCNTGLGNFFDNPALLWKAIQYLAKYAKIQDVS